MMTSVLRDSLGGNCKTVMVATINPEARHTDESVSTCRFAQRVALIENKAVRKKATSKGSCNYRWSNFHEFISLLLSSFKSKLSNKRKQYY